MTITLKSHFPDTSFKTLREDLEGDTSNGLYLLATQLVKKKEAKVVLLVDQFEEAFTLVTDEAQRQHFFDLLVTAVTEPRSPLFVILTLRADFYDRPMHYPELFRLIDDHHVSVLPLERDDLRSVIEQPAILPEVQLTFEKGLVDELLIDMQGQSGALPLLEFTLDQLFQRRSGHQLTLQAYRKMGGVKGALSQHAEETYQKLTPEQQKAARDIFLRLIEPGTTEQDATRHRATRSEFESADPIEEQRMRETLEAFYKARLLTTNQSGSTVEVSHEALIQEWTTLSEWLREASNDIHFQRSLSEDVKEWEQRKWPSVRLYRGAQLKEAQAWARRNRPSEQEVAFLRASAARRRLSRLGVFALVLLLLSLTGIAGGVIGKLPPNPTVVTTLQDNMNGSLRYCIENAPSGSTIRFAPGLRGTIELRESLGFLSGEQLTISNPEADPITISGGNNTFAHIYVPWGATVNISDLSFKNSETTIDAFLFNEGTLTMTNSVISGNKTTATVTSYGGGIENTGTLTVKDSIISNNSSSASDDNGEGGGIYNQGKLTVTNSTFSINSASSSGSSEYYAIGGGIYNANIGTLMVTDSIFSGNSASSSGSRSSYGGGIDNDGKLTVISSTFLGNSANSSGGESGGGGIHSTGTLMATDSTFSDNWASGNQDGQGGGIDNEGKLTVISSTFSGNSASSSGRSFGGGIYNYSTGTLVVTTSTFSDNSASGEQGGEGGGIDNDGKLTLTTSTFSGNSASFGGGILSFGTKGSSAIIRFCTIYGNSSSAGGGIWVDPKGNSHLTISSSIIAANSAPSGLDIFGALTSGGYNLIENVAGVTGLNASTDRQMALADLKINSSLSNNGGPTQTLALLQGSPAIDAVPQQACGITVTDPSGHSVTITTDQRGDPRPDGSENVCDIGAYESSY